MKLKVLILFQHLGMSFLTLNISLFIRIQSQVIKNHFTSKARSFYKKLCIPLFSENMEARTNLMTPTQLMK